MKKEGSFEKKGVMKKYGKLRREVEWKRRGNGKGRRNGVRGGMEKKGERTRGWNREERMGMENEGGK